MADKADNYEKLCENFRRIFLETDICALLKKLPEIKNEEEYLSVLHYGDKYLINKKTGIITNEGLNENIPESIKLNIYTLFYYCLPNARLSGEFVNFSELRYANVFTYAFEKGLVKPFASCFDGKKICLLKALKA